jgi:hypothetical protein
VDPLVAEMANGGYRRASAERKSAWRKLWDLFGPPGERDELKTSAYAQR